MDPVTKRWTDYARKHLVGRTIKAIGYMSAEEADELGWYGRALVIELDDGTALFPSQDDEGNDAGALFGQGPSGAELTFPVL